MRYWIYLALVCTTSMPIVHAMEEMPSGPLTLHQVMIKVLAHNPLLGMHDYAARAAATKIRQAKQAPPAEIGLDLQNVMGNGTYRGINQIEATLSMAKTLELGHKADFREDLALQQVNLLKNEHDRKRLDLLAIAAERFIHVVADQHQLYIAQEQLQLVQRTHELVVQRVKAGRSHIAEQRKASITLTRAEIELEHAEHELSASRLRLSINWGEMNPHFSIASAALFVLPAVDSFEVIEKNLLNNPDLIRFATKKKLVQAQLNLAQTRGTANMKVSAGIRYFGAQNNGALVLSASMPFGQKARATPYIEEMQFLTQREPLHYQQQYLQLHSDLYGIYQELLHAQTAFNALSKSIIPEAERAAEDYENGYKRGRFSLLELHEAQQTLLDVRLEAVFAATNYHRFQIEIERLIGTSFSANSSTGVLHE